MEAFCPDRCHCWPHLPVLSLRWCFLNVTGWVSFCTFLISAVLSSVLMCPCLSLVSPWFCCLVALCSLSSGAWHLFALWPCSVFPPSSPSHLLASGSGVNALSSSSDEGSSTDALRERKTSKEKGNETHVLIFTSPAGHVPQINSSQIHHQIQAGQCNNSLKKPPLNPSQQKAKDWYSFPKQLMVLVCSSIKQNSLKYLQKSCFKAGPLVGGKLTPLDTQELMEGLQFFYHDYFSKRSYRRFNQVQLAYSKYLFLAMQITSLESDTQSCNYSNHCHTYSFL